MRQKRSRSRRCVKLQFRPSASGALTPCRAVPLPRVIEDGADKCNGATEKDDFLAHTVIGHAVAVARCWAAASRQFGEPRSMSVP